MHGVRGRLFFIAPDGGDTALWEREPEIHVVMSLGDATHTATRLAAAGGLLYFVRDAGTGAAGLWRSDGTAGGTFEVVEADATQLTAAGTHLFFRHPAPAGDELWRSDGTVAGTIRVAALTPTAMVGAGSTLYFTASDEAGAELWRSDGTAAGTQRVADLVPGPGGSDPAELTATCNRLFFTATTPGSGRELWALDVAEDCSTAPTSCTADADCNAGPLCEATCDAISGCVAQPSLCCQAACDDHDRCTVDACDPLVGCSHTPAADLDAITCVLGDSGSEAPLCPTESLPKRLTRPFDRARLIVTRAQHASSRTQAERRIAGAVRTLDHIAQRIDHAAVLGLISPACRDRTGAVYRRRTDARGGLLARSLRPHGSRRTGAARGSC